MRIYFIVIVRMQNFPHLGIDLRTDTLRTGQKLKFFLTLFDVDFGIQSWVALDSLAGRRLMITGLV